MIGIEYLNLSNHIVHVLYVKFHSTMLNSSIINTFLRRKTVGISGFLILFHFIYFYTGDDQNNPPNNILFRGLKGRDLFIGCIDLLHKRRP